MLKLKYQNRIYVVYRENYLSSNGTQVRDEINIKTETIDFNCSFLHDT